VTGGRRVRPPEIDLARLCPAPILGRLLGEQPAPFRTAAALPFQVALVDTAGRPIYQEIARQALFSLASSA
jgi:hypothetical protein